jgi:16S rRNA (cytidine1402-2'-O)-methyltransferase
LAARPDPPPLDGAPLAPGLYVVATPIGSLRDVTLRALDVLAGADLILAEDTRVTAKLLAAYKITGRLERYDDHAGARVRPRVLAALAEGGRVALCSDAGTPLISDPGYRLVTEAIAQGSAVIPVPGASSVTAALSAAGLPTDRFLFAGFPSAKAAARRAAFAELAPVRSTLVFFESGARLAGSLADMAAAFGSREAVVAREITKRHETFRRGPLEALAADPALQAPKGEMVIVVGPGGPAAASPADADAALSEALERLSPSEAAAEVARALGLDRRTLYRRAIALKRGP